MTFIKTYKVGIKSTIRKNQIHHTLPTGLPQLPIMRKYLKSKIIDLPYVHGSTPNFFANSMLSSKISDKPYLNEKPMSNNFLEEMGTLLRTSSSS